MKLLGSIKQRWMKKWWKRSSIRKHWNSVSTLEYCQTIVIDVTQEPCIYFFKINRFVIAHGAKCNMWNFLRVSHIL